ncbi:MAG: TIGR01459 family HAD-type hydrolase [Hyphomicrobiales bacterium]
MTARPLLPIAARRLSGADDLSHSHPVWLCDVWGVVHDGTRANPEACDALIRHRARGGAVILMTNAPRRSPTVTRLFPIFGVPEGTHDAIVSSGDVTRRLIERRAGETLHHLGPARDRDLLVDLPVTFGAFEDSSAVVCTGLLNDEDAPEDYDPLLARMRERSMPMICANPDRVVHVGPDLFWCAGALAERLEAIGGGVEMAGKPYAPIYDEALRLASVALGRPVDRHEALAIGDGLLTDIAGAARNGIDALFIAGGIHREETAGVDAAGLGALIAGAAPGIRLAGVMDALSW